MLGETIHHMGADSRLARLLAPGPSPRIPAMFSSPRRRLPISSGVCPIAPGRTPRVIAGETCRGQGWMRAGTNQAGLLCSRSQATEQNHTPLSLIIEPCHHSCRRCSTCAACAACHHRSAALAFLASFQVSVPFFPLSRISSWGGWPSAPQLPNCRVWMGHCRRAQPMRCRRDGNHGRGADRRHATRDEGSRRGLPLSEPHGAPMWAELVEMRAAVAGCMGGSGGPLIGVGNWGRPAPRLSVRVRQGR